MRIGILSQWYDPEPGPAAIPGVVARGLRDAGHQVSVLTGFPNYPSGRIADGYRQTLHAVEHRDGIAIHRVPLYPSHDRSAVGRVANYASFAASASAAALATMGSVDALWVCNSPATIGFPAGVLRLIARKPFVLQIQDLWPDSVLASGLIASPTVNAVVKGTLDALCNATYRMASEVAVSSPGMMSILGDRGVRTAKMSWVPNCTDETVFCPQPYDDAYARRERLDGKFTLMYGGSLGDVQSLDTAVRAAHLLRHDPRFELVLVGSGVAEQSLKALVHELELHNVRFLGRRPAAEMPALMRATSAQLISLSDLPVFASTMPSKIAAVMASARPAVVAVRGDAADLVATAQAGLTCPPDDPAALASVIQSLAALPQGERDKMSAAGRAYYLAQLSAGHMVEKLEDLLSRAAVTAGARRSHHQPRLARPPVGASSRAGTT